MLYKSTIHNIYFEGLSNNKSGSGIKNTTNMVWKASTTARPEFPRTNLTFFLYTWSQNSFTSRLFS